MIQYEEIKQLTVTEALDEYPDLWALFRKALPAESVKYLARCVSIAVALREERSYDYYH